VETDTFQCISAYEQILTKFLGGDGMAQGPTVRILQRILCRTRIGFSVSEYASIFRNILIDTLCVIIFTVIDCMSLPSARFHSV